MSAERRSFTRISFDTAAELSSAGPIVKVKVLDLSLKGALVEVPAAAVVVSGAPCTLTVPLVGGDGLTMITMDVTVAHIEGRHIGLRCRSIDLDSITHLRALIRLNLGDPALLDREVKALVSG